MNTFFKPAERLLGKFSLPGKIAAIGAAFLAIVAMLYGFFLNQHRASLEFSSRERVGVQVIAPVIEISEALGIPMGSVMSRLYYARRKLADVLNALLDE